MKKQIEFNNEKISIIGISQIGDGKIENQDSFDVYIDEKILIITIADGLGSASFSKEGSQKICSIAIEYLKENFLNINCYDIQQLWKDAVKTDFNLYDTTLKFVIITNESVICGGVGDGWIIIKGKNIFDNIEMNHVFSNQTDTILSLGLNEKFFQNKYLLNEVNTILLATDGFSEDIDKKNAFEFISSLENSIDENVDNFYYELKNTLENWPVKSNKDDKTVVIIKRTE